MNQYKERVASVDIDAYIAGLGDLVATRVGNGFEPYMLSFMFRSHFDDLNRLGAMRHEIERVYSRFLTECHRNPNSDNNTHNKPILIGCPDWPVFKRRKADRVKADLPGEGAHWGAILLVPPYHRLKHGIVDHFTGAKRSAYIRSDTFLTRIHVEHVTYSIRQSVAYTLKSLQRRRCGIDDILVLPRARSEMTRHRGTNRGAVY